MDPLPEANRCESVAQVVQPDSREFRFLDHAIVVDTQRARVHRRPDSSREYQTLVLPERTRSQPRLSLALSMRPERGDDGGCEVDRAARFLGFRFLEYQTGRTSA